MRTRYLIIVALALAAIGALAAAWLRAAQITPSAAPAVASAPEPEPEPVPEPSEPVLETLAPSRNVTPPETLPWPIPEGPIERLPARVPPSPPPKPPEPDQLGRIIVADAGTLRAGETEIRLSGIDAPPPGARCTDAGGRDWPCGQAAITELRMLIRGRAVSCDPLPDGANPDTPRRCELSGIDLAEWLLRQGWGEPAPDASGAYRAAHEDAREAGRGAFGKAWGLPAEDLPALDLPSVEQPALDGAEWRQPE